MTDKAPAKFLFVDDDEETTELLEAIVRVYFPESNIASINQSMHALQTIELMKPDVVFLDIMMAGINGIAICKFVKIDPHINKTIVIIVSALGDDGTQRDAFNAGADEFITKPIIPNKFINRVEEVFRRKQLGIYSENS
jgi:DNA-binding response OmpR family regulator